MPISLDPVAVLVALAHVVLGVVVLIVAKLCKDMLSPYAVDSELTAKDNPAFGLAVAGYYAGVVAIYLGAARSEAVPLDAGTTGALKVLGLDVAWAVAGILALNASRWLMDRVLIPQSRNSQEIVANRNLAAGAVECGVYLATGLVLASAIGARGATVVTAIVFFLLSQFVLVVLGRAYERFAGYSVGEEVRKGNFAAGVPFGLTLVALALLMMKATSGEFVDWTTSLTFFAIDSITGFLLLMLLRWVTDLALLPNARISEEVVRDGNTNAGLVEGVLAVGIAAIILFLF